MRFGFMVATGLYFAIAVALGCGGSSSSGSGGETGSTTGGTGGSSSTTSGGTTTTTTSGGSGGNTGSSSSSSSSSSSGLGGSAAGGDCGKCIVDNKVFAAGTACANAYNACTQDPTCNAFHVCVDQCLLEVPQTSACWDACEQGALAVANLYQPFAACFCGMCKDDCALACAP